MQPAASPQNKTPASVRGGVLGHAGVVDVAALSYAARRHTIHIPLPALVQNATTNHSLGAAAMAGTIVAAYISYRTIPAVASSGTATYRLGKRAADGTQTLFSDSANLLALTNAVAASVALTTTDVAATDTLEFQAVVSNNTVTQGADGYLVLVLDPTDPAVISQ